VHLYKSVRVLQDLISSEYSKLLLKYKHDMPKLKAFESMMQRATTVSERDTIMEARNGVKPIAYVSFPTCTNLDALAAVFHRLRTMHTAPDTKELDHMIIELFRGATLRPKPQHRDFTVPVWRVSAFASSSSSPSSLSSVASSSSKEPIDVITLLRLFPAYLRVEQERLQQTVSPDFTLQIKTAKRLACVLLVAQLQGANFPAWLTSGLVRQVHLDASLTSDREDENLTGYWMHVLRQLGSERGLAPADLERINKRLQVQALKRFLAKENIARSLHYQVPMYPGTLPFMDVDDPAAYLVFCAPNGAADALAASAAAASASGASSFGEGEMTYVDPVSGKHEQRARILTDQKEIDRAYVTNLAMRGAYIRPTYLTGGAVVLWNEAGPSRAQLLEKYVRDVLHWAPQQIKAHLHLLQNAQSEIGVVEFGGNREHVMARINTIRQQLRRAPALVEDVTVLVAAPYFLRELLAQLEAEGGAQSVYTARALRALAVYGRIDHIKYDNETDYCLGVADGSLPPPPVVEAEAALAPLNHPPHSGLAELYAWMRSACAKAVERSLVSPPLLGAPTGLIVTAVDAKKAAAESKEQEEEEEEDASETHVAKVLALGDCPIGLEPMQDPVSITPCGHSFDRVNLMPILAAGRTTCPVCIGHIKDTTTNFTLRDVLLALQRKA